MSNIAIERDEERADADKAARLQSPLGKGFEMGREGNFSPKVSPKKRHRNSPNPLVIIIYICYNILYIIILGYLYLLYRIDIL